MTCAGYVWGGAFALGLGVALVGGAAAASADSSDGESPSGAAAAANSHSTSIASSRRAVTAKPAGARVSAVPKGVLRAARPVGQPRLPELRSQRQARSLRTAAAAPPGDAVAAADGAGVSWQDLPPSYYVNSSMQSFRDGSWNITVTGVSGPDGSRDDAEIFVLAGDGENYVNYTRLYLNQTANVMTGNHWDLKAFDPGVLPGDFGLAEVPAGPPRRLPNSAAEYQREQLSSVLGLIPVVAQVVGALNLVQDAIELRDAQRRGDIDDIADEKADLRTDLIFQVLGVRQLQGLVAVVTLPAVVAFSAFYLVIVMQCNAKPGSESCWSLI